jgi:plastocyanin domain-containing protein
MQIKKSTLKKVSVLIVLGLIVLLFFGSNTKNPDSNGTTLGATPQIVGDKQILNLTAKGGYTPQVIEAKADMPAILKVQTKSTFDCSAALVISDLKVNEILPPNGVKEIEIPAQKPGSEIIGTCSMGMYGFKIKFV